MSWRLSWRNVLTLRRLGMASQSGEKKT